MAAGCHEHQRHEVEKGLDKLTENKFLSGY